MGVAGGPYIVRDSSLVLELDAADRNSYVSGSSTWRDLSQNINNLTLSGQTFVDQKLGTIQFDGTSSYGSIGYTPSLSVPNYHTIEAWVYVIGAGVNSGATGVIIRAGQVTDEQYSLFALPGGGWYSQWVSGSSFFAVGDATYGPPQTWNHFTLVRDLTNMSFYYNGVQTFNQTVDITTRSSFGSLTIGRCTSNTSQRFYGNISNLRVYNRALSTQEILQNYNALKSRFNL